MQRTTKVRQYAQIIASVCRDVEQRRCCFLVGAGISMLPPTLFPSGAELKDWAIFSLLQHRELKKYVPLLKGHRKYQEIVPEIVFQRLFESVQKQLLPFFDVVAGGRPNLAHAMLGEFCDRYHIPVLTTNFDNLIESQTTDNSHIFHLHGSISNPDSMMVRINQVGRGLESQARQDVLATTAGKSVYVLGYSGNDRDIIDALKASSLTRIAWSTRANRDERVEANVATLGERKRVDLFQCDLNRFFGDLWKRFKRKTPPKVSSSPKRHRSLVGPTTRWTSNVDTPSRFACLAKVMFEIQEYERAAEVALYAVRKGYVGGVHSASWFYNEAADDFRVVGRFGDGFECVRKAIASQSKPRDLAALAASYSMKGLLFLEKERPEAKKAIPWFRKAIECLNKYSRTDDAKNWKEETKMFLGYFYNNLGLAYDNVGMMRRAVSRFRWSLKYKGLVGDLIGISMTSTNLALTYYKMREYARYHIWKRRATELIEKYDLGYQRAYLARRIGEISCDRRRIKFGLRHLREALKLYEAIPSAQFDLQLTKETIARFESRP